MTATQIDTLARKLTASRSLHDLCGPRGEGYRPSIRCLSGLPGVPRVLLVRLADAYDAFQAARGDGRRAYRC